MPTLLLPSRDRKPVRTVGGVEVWVANTPRPVSATLTTTVEYRVYFAVNRNVYTGELIRLP